VLLRYTLAQALYFYLHTGAIDGKILTPVYASDSPYDPKKNSIGDVATPMFEQDAEARHLQKLEKLLREWVNFVRDTPDTHEPFAAFELNERRE